MNRVLVVDDEPQILRAMRINLRARGYDVRTAADGRQALSEAASYRPDIVVLDLGLPDLDGVDVIRGLRGWTTVPIIVLSGRTTSSDKVDALDAGADDYVTKPFGMDELFARLRAVSRRVPGDDEEAPSVVIGDHLVDLAAHRVTRRAAGAGLPDLADGSGPSGQSPVDATVGDGAEVRLTPTEWQLLEDLGAPPREAGQPARAAGPGVGARLPARLALPARVHGPAAPQAGARPVPPPAPAHRARHGLPLPAVGCASCR